MLDGRGERARDGREGRVPRGDERLRVPVRRPVLAGPLRREADAELEELWTGCERVAEQVPRGQGRGDVCGDGGEGVITREAAAG